MKSIRSLIHFLLLIGCFAAFSIASTAGAVLAWLAILARKVHPAATVGNCWTHALPNWWVYGGYLAMRSADGQKFLGIFPVMHVIWVKSLPRKTSLEQYVPIKRQISSILPWYTVAYRGVVRKVEAPHNARLEG